MDTQERTSVSVAVDSLPGDIDVHGFGERYALHQMRNHESVLAVLVRMLGYGLIGVGVLLLLFGPKTVTVHALYGPTLGQQLLLIPQFPVIVGALLLGCARLLARVLDGTPLPVLEFFDRHYLLRLDRRLASGQQVRIRHCGGDRFAVRLQPSDLTETAPSPPTKPA